MPWEISVENGFVNVDPPLPDLVRIVNDNAEDYGVWGLSDNGSQIVVLESLNMSSDVGEDAINELDELVTTIRTNGSFATGEFFWETSEGAQGKWVVDSLGVNEVDAFLAYEDCKHDGPNHLRLVDTRLFDIVPKQG